MTSWRCSCIRGTPQAAYQWLARRWARHGKLTVALLVVNLLWLLPWAMLEARLPGYAAAIGIAALAPLRCSLSPAAPGVPYQPAAERLNRA